VPAKFRIALILFFFLNLFLPWSMAADNGTDNKNIISEKLPLQSNNRQDQESNITASRITDEVKKAGVKSCAGRINQFTDFLTTGLKSGAVLFVPQTDPDKSIVSLSLGLETPNGMVAYASESFAPNQANGCGGVYETVAYWDSGCADVAKRQFPGFKNSGLIVKNLMMLDKGSNVKVFLMPAGNGCVAIKKEVLN